MKKFILPLLFLPFALMAETITNVNIGTANAGNGDPLRTAMIKLNENDNFLQTQVSAIAGNGNFGTNPITGAADFYSKLTAGGYIVAKGGITSTNSGNDDYTESFGYQAGVPGGTGAQFSGNVGYQAGYSTKNMQFSVNVGYQAGALSDDEYATLAMGYLAGQTSLAMVSSVALGYSAGRNANSLTVSELVGVHAGENSSNMVDVIAIGYHAGEASTNMANTIAIGDRAGQTMPSTTGGIFIGDYQSPGGNYKLGIDGMGGVDSTHRNAGALITGDFNARTLSVQGSITATNGYFLGTNTLNTGVFVAGGPAYVTNLTGNITLGKFAGVPTDKAWAITVFAQNTSGSDKTVTSPAGVVNNADGTAAPVITVTNGATLVFQYVGYGQIATNLCSPH